MLKLNPSSVEFPMVSVVNGASTEADIAREALAVLWHEAGEQMAHS
jgi:hypothetical protein